MTTLEIFLMVLMGIIVLVCVFAVLVIIRDIKRESAANKRAKQEQVKKECPAECCEKAPAPIAKEEVAPAQAEPEIDQDGAVVFSADKSQSLEEKYFALDKDARGRYDEIVKYASAVEDSKRFKNLRYEEYKVGSARIIRVLIKRGVIVCEFIMHNANFKSYVSENKISVKQSATVIKVVDDEAVQVIKDTIDIVVNAIKEEKEIKKQLAREKRKAKRQENN